MNALFLPGIVAPASLRYAPLLQHLKDVNALVCELAVYAGDSPPPNYSIDTEIDAIDAAADRAKFDRFHLCAHSGGGACALAYIAKRPERVLTLAVDEPATDLTAGDHADPYWKLIDEARSLPDREATLAFLRLQLAPGALPPIPQGAPPPWMAKRPAGIRAISRVLERYEVDPDRYRSFHKPVLYTHGSMSHPRWIAMRDRLAGLFPDFRAELFEGLHHLNTSHQAEPARTADLLRAHWARA
jgi:pimeloyl-ACP methyl ester carboxylesterase